MPRTENLVTLVRRASAIVFGIAIRSCQLKVFGFLQSPLTSIFQPSRSSLPGCPSAQKTGVRNSLSLLIRQYLPRRSGNTESFFLPFRICASSLHRFISVPHILEPHRDENPGENEFQV